MRALVTALLPLLVLGCAGTDAPPAPEPDSAPYVFCLLVAGESREDHDAAARERIQAEHLANIERLAESGDILIAGPFGAPNPDPRRRGVFIFDADSLARAEALTRTDPAVKAGVLGMELAPLRSSPRWREIAALERETSERLRREKPGEPAFEIRGYTLLLVAEARDEAQAAAVAALEAAGHTVLEGRLGAPMADRRLVILDLADPDEARKIVESTLGRPGGPTYEMHPWWASANIARLGATLR
ncbi:MAG: YciI family protein [Planctomycetota bacterium]